MNCKLYVHSNSIRTVISILERVHGVPKKERNDYYFDDFVLYINRNKEADANKLCSYPDGFLYYELIVDLEINTKAIPITASILQSLWHNNIPTVVSCDYERELNDYIFNQ